MSRPPQPQVRDVIGIVEFVRQYGSVEYPVDGVALVFANWRAGLRAEAKRVGIRISVRRVLDIVLVLNPDHRPTDAQLRAAIEGMPAVPPTASGAQARSLTRRRRHLRLVRE